MSTNSKKSITTLTEKSDQSVRSIEGPTGASSNDIQAQWTPTKRELLVMISLSIVSLMVALDATVVVTSLQSIISGLEGNATQSFWIGTSYLLSCAVIMPSAVSLSEMVGRSACLLGSLTIFTIGTTVCCLARNFATLIGGRCVQGVGGGGVVILSLVIFTDIVPLRFRSKYYGTVQAAWALGTCVGPVVGGAFTEHTTWRWVFYLMFPFCGVGIATLSLLMATRPISQSVSPELARVNWPGELLFLTSSVSLLIAISRGGTQAAWGSFHTIVPLVMGGLGMIVGGLWKERNTNASSQDLRSRLGSSAAYLASSIQGLLLYGLLYYIPLYWFIIHGHSAVRVGVNLLPLSIVLVPASVVVGILITSYGRFRWAVWTGWMVVVISHGLTISWGLEVSTAHWVITTVTLGTGHGLVLTSLNFAIQAMAPPGAEAKAAANYMFYRSFGMALGVGIGGSVFQNITLIKLDYYDLDSTIARDADIIMNKIWTNPHTKEMHQILESYLYGLRGVYSLFCAVASLALFVSFMIGRGNINKQQVTRRGADEQITRHAIRHL